MSAALIVFASLAVAKTGYAPLPKDVVEAKTIFIDNCSRHADLGDKAYDELRKWGRYQIVDTPDTADLILLLSASSYDRGYRTRGSNRTYGRVDDSGNVNLHGESDSRAQHVTVNYTHITLINRKNGANLWRDQKKWGWHSATRGLIKELRDRVQEQELAGTK